MSFWSNMIQYRLSASPFGKVSKALRARHFLPPLSVDSSAGGTAGHVPQQQHAAGAGGPGLRPDAAPKQRPAATQGSAAGAAGRRRSLEQDKNAISQNGCGSNIGTQNETLVNGTKGQNPRSPVV